MGDATPEAFFCIGAKQQLDGKRSAPPVDIRSTREDMSVACQPSKKQVCFFLKIVIKLFLFINVCELEKEE